MMSFENSVLKGEDGKSFVTYRWGENKNNPVVQIIHGMAEYAGRYEEFASFLAQNGFTVYAHDHRGHGKTGELNNSFGFFAEKKGWDLAVSDIKTLNSEIRKNHPGSRIFMLGHSMGSMLLRDFLLNQSNMTDGAVIMGTGAHPGALIHLGVFLASLHSLIFGGRSRKNIINIITNLQFNFKFAGLKLGFKWLSRDDACEKSFINDPLCLKSLSSSFYKDLFHGVKKINDKSNLDKMNKELPVLLISGEDDPVGDFSKGVKKVYGMFRDQNMKNTDIKLYEKARHEILNETNKEEVYSDILLWLKAVSDR